MKQQVLSPTEKCMRADQIVSRYAYDDKITEEMMDQAECHMLSCKNPDSTHTCHVYVQNELYTQEEVIVETSSCVI